MAKGRVPANKSMIEVSASVAKLKAEFQDIIKLVEKLSKEGKSAKEIYDAQSSEIEKQLKLLEQESAQLERIKKTLKDKVESNAIDSKQRADYTKALNKAVSLEKQLGTVKKNVQNAMIAAFQEEQAQYRNMVELGDKELSQMKEKLEAVNRASNIKSVENRIKEEGLAITEREKNQQQQLRDQIKEGNARRTQEVKDFEARSRDFQKRRQARLKELGKLEEQQARDRQAAAKTQLEIDLKILNRGKMTLEQRRDAQKRLIQQFRAGYDQQSNDYKRLTLRLVKLDEDYEKRIAKRDSDIDKGRQDFAKREETRQKRLDAARRSVFKAELDLSKKTAKEKINDVNTYYNSALRTLRILGKENTAEYKQLYAEQLRLLKKYNREADKENKAAAAKAKVAPATAPRQRQGFLEGVRRGFDSGDLGRSIGRLTGVGTAISALRKVFQTLREAITGSFQAAVDFEAQLAQLQAVTGINNEELSRLEKNVLDVAGSTKFTSEEIVQLQTELGKLGFSVAEIEQATIAVARTAQALGEQVGPVAQRIGQILNQFNLDAAETTRVSDALVSVINSSALSFEGFSTALQYIGPLGAEVGTTFEETSVAMALLADNGFTASRIGTGLRGILTELSTTGKDLNTVIEDLADKEITLAEAVDLVGKRNAAQLLTLVETAKRQDELGKSLDDLNDQYFNQGSAAIAAAQQVDTFQGNLDLLKSAVNRVQIAFGNFLKTSKLLRFALKLIDEEGYNAALAAEALAATDPTKFSQELSNAAEEVGKLKQELTDIDDVRNASRKAAEQIVQETIITPLEEELSLLKQGNKAYEENLQKRLDAANAAKEAAKEAGASSDEIIRLGNIATTISDELADKRNIADEAYVDNKEKIEKIEARLAEMREKGFEAEIDYVQTLVNETGLQNALERERNAVVEERKETLDSLRKERDEEIKDLKAANDFNVKANSEATSIQEEINALLAEQAQRKEEGNEIVGEELLLFNARLNQLKEEKNSLANLVVQRGELEQLAQKEFEKEFKQLANRIEARKQELADQQSILDVQIKTQENLAKNAKTEEERVAAAKELNRLQVQRSKNEKQAFEDLSAIAQEYRTIIEGVGREIDRAELDGRFLEKAEERLKSFELSFSDLNISFDDIAKATGELGDALATTFKDKLTKGIALDSSDLADVDLALENLILGMFPAIEKGSDEFNEMFSILRPLLLSNLIPDNIDDKDVQDKIKKILGKIIDKLADAAKDYNQTALENTQNRLNAELEAIKNKFRVEEEIIKSQLNNQLITESQFRAKQKEIRQKQLAEENSIREKVFEAEKKADLNNVAIEAAEALASNIINNFKSFDTIKATGLTAAGNFVILGGAALKADAIRRRKFYPVKYEQGGMVQGPSHAEGGVPFTVQGRSGYEMEGGEFIVNKKAASIHRGLLEKINNSYKVPSLPSQYKFATGGLVQAQADESVNYLKAIAEATVSTAINSSKPLRAFVSAKDLRQNENERRLRDRNDRV